MVTKPVVNNGVFATTPGEAYTFTRDLSGAGSYTGDIVVQSTFRPGNSPAIVNVDNITFTNTAVLEMEIGGLTPGTQHDQLVVSGTAMLGGRLEVPIIDDFAPTLGDKVDIITGGTIVGTFDEAIAPNPPADLAMLLTQDSSTVSIEFVPPVPQDYDPASGGGIWSNTGVWLQSAVPESDNNLTVSNTVGGGQVLTVDTDAFANKVDVDSTLGTMRLVVPSSVSLSSLNAVDVGNSGTLELNGGTVLTNRLDVSSGGVLTGDGNVIGNVVVGAGNGQAQFEPGGGSGSSGQVHIEGSLDLASSATTTIDLNATSNDSITLEGEVSLGGELDIDLSGITAPTITGGTYAHDVRKIITADTWDGTRFDDVDASNVPAGFTIRVLYPDSTSASNNMLFQRDARDVGDLPQEVYVGFGHIADVQFDGVLDNNDIQAFALALSNPESFQNTYHDSPEYLADINGDEVFNFDDIKPFAQLVNDLFPGMSSENVYAAVVPEPGCFSLAFVALILTVIGQRRRTNRFKVNRGRN